MAGRLLYSPTGHPSDSAPSARDWTTPGSSAGQGRESAAGVRTALIPGKTVKQSLHDVPTAKGNTLQLYFKIINAEIKQVELTSIIFNIRKVNKATGQDPISYIMIKRFPPSFINILHDFYNYCWSTGDIPQSWKEAQVVPIYKQGKPNKDPKSYRPISLTHHLGKVFERIIKYRLDDYLEKQDVLPRYQAGFRKHRSCMEHIVKISSHARKALARRKKILSTFFDIRAAYDTVWHNKLLQKLNKIGINGNMMIFIQTFLSNHSLQVKVG